MPFFKRNYVSSFDIFRKVITAILVLGWSILTWVVFFIRNFGNNSNESLMTHFTNWNWILLGIFFIVYFISIFEQSGIVELFVLNMFYVATLTSCTIVFYFVLVILHDNPNILLDESTLFGGKYYIGDVFVFNALLHNFIYIVMLYFTILNIDKICRAFYKGFTLSSDIIYKILYIIIQFVLSIILPIIYLCGYNVREIYDLTTSTALITFIFFAIYIFGVAIPFIGMLWAGSHFLLIPNKKSFILKLYKRHKKRKS